MAGPDPTQTPAPPSAAVRTAPAVAILDCGGQYTKVIDRRVRELAVRSEIYPLDVDPARLEGVAALILSGGPESVTAESALRYPPEIFESGRPLLGICYGMQLLSHHFGGSVEASDAAEYGVETITVDPSVPLFRGLEPRQTVLMSHGDAVAEPPPGFRVAARSANHVAAIADEARALYGVQFHPEVDLSEHGTAVLDNFLTIAGIARDYVLEDRIEAAVRSIRERVGDGDVVALVSGGVDSAVTAALLLRALPPERVYAVHVDHGLMRKDESRLVADSLRAQGLANLRVVDASAAFFEETAEIGGETVGPLPALVDPERRREFIGHRFLDVLNAELDALGLDPDTTFIAQGTLRPDLIESGNPDVSASAHTIKTHHNDVARVREARARGLIVETNADWHKDEIRRVAVRLGLPEAVAQRQPFPGPGLALRVMGYDGSERVPEDLDARIAAHLASDPDLAGGGAGDDGGDGGAGGYAPRVRTVPIRTVGVQGDYRSYRFLTLLGGVAPGGADPDRLGRIGRAIPNRFREVNRVALLLDPARDPAAVRAHVGGLERASVALVREVDALVRDALAGLPLSQVLAVLLPVGVDRPWSVAVRTFITNDYMTGRHAAIGRDVPLETATTLRDAVAERFDEIDLVLWDITSKPPATVEWL